MKLTWRLPSSPGSVVHRQPSMALSDCRPPALFPAQLREFNETLLERSPLLPVAAILWMDYLAEWLAPVFTGLQSKAQDLAHPAKPRPPETGPSPHPSEGDGPAARRSRAARRQRQTSGGRANEPKLRLTKAAYSPEGGRGRGRGSSSNEKIDTEKIGTTPWGFLFREDDSLLVFCCNMTLRAIHWGQWQNHKI